MKGKKMGNSISIMTIVLTSSVIAALLTSILNLVIALMNRKNLKDLERMKAHNEFLFHRFKTLQEIRSDIITSSKEVNFGVMVKALENKDNALLDWGQTEIRLHSEKVSLFNKYAYYFDDDLQAIIRKAIDDIEKYMVLIKQYLVDNLDKKHEKVPQEFLEIQGQIFSKIVEFEKLLMSCFDTQLSKIKSQLQR